MAQNYRFGSCRISLSSLLPVAVGQKLIIGFEGRLPFETGRWNGDFGICQNLSLFQTLIAKIRRITLERLE
jgi:hypothetical protein